jgi:hypothetical protein
MVVPEPRLPSLHERLTSGPVGVMGHRAYAEHHIAQVEGSLQALRDIELPLDLIDRVERTLTRMHTHNLLAIDGREGEVGW